MPVRAVETMTASAMGDLLGRQASALDDDTAASPDGWCAVVSVASRRAADAARRRFRLPVAGRGGGRRARPRPRREAAHLTPGSPPFCGPLRRPALPPPTGGDESRDPSQPWTSRVAPC